MKKNKILNIAVIGIFAAIIAIVSFTPLRTFGLEITFSMVPVAVGAIAFGQTVGGILGGFFGIVSFIQCITGFSPFGAMLLSINPLLTALMCIPTRALAGYVSGFVFSKMNRGGELTKAAYPLCALLAPLLNTLLFTGTMILCFYNTDYIQGFVRDVGAANPFMFMVIFVGVNGAIELACGFAIAYPAAVAVRKVIRA